MRWIQIAGVIAGQLASPCQCAVGLEQQEAAIMHIAAFRVGQIAEKPLLDHVSNHHHIIVVAAVFGQHVELARLFSCADNPPTFLNGHGAGNFGQHMFASSHRLDRHDCVPLHGRGDDHRVEIVALQHSLIVFGAVRVADRLAAIASFRHEFSGIVEGGRIDIA